jgi:hypothetical protein
MMIFLLSQQEILTSGAEKSLEAASEGDYGRSAFIALLTLGFLGALGAGWLFRSMWNKLSTLTEKAIAALTANRIGYDEMRKEHEEFKKAQTKNAEGCTARLLELERAANRP